MIADRLAAMSPYSPETDGRLTLRKAMTKQEPIAIRQFLAWEQMQELRYEFDGFQPIAMAGGTAAHAAI